jgi:hypothetical protein
MSIITKPTVITKGVPAIFTLDKDALASLPSVAGSAYYSDTTNWNKVILNYGSSVNNQFHIVTFDATQVAPEGYFLASDKAENIFNIISISIIDFDNGVFRIPNTELVPAEFLIDMGPSVAVITGNFASGLPAGWYNGGADVSGGVANFNSPSALLTNGNISGPYVIVSGQTYTVRIYVASLLYSSGSKPQLAVTLRGSSNAVFTYDAMLPLVGSYIDIPCVADSTGWELYMTCIDTVTGSKEIRISKIEILL